jgi:hypothetical protein
MNERHVPSAAAKQKLDSLWLQQKAIDVHFHNLSKKTNLLSDVRPVLQTNFSPLSPLILNSCAYSIRHITRKKR